MSRLKIHPTSASGCILSTPLPPTPLHCPQKEGRLPLPSTAKEERQLIYEENDFHDFPCLGSPLATPRMRTRRAGCDVEGECEALGMAAVKGVADEYAIILHIHYVAKHFCSPNKAAKVVYFLPAQFSANAFSPRSLPSMILYRAHNGGVSPGGH